MIMIRIRIIFSKVIVIVILVVIVAKFIPVLGLGLL